MNLIFNMTKLLRKNSKGNLQHQERNHDNKLEDLNIQFLLHSVFIEERQKRESNKNAIRYTENLIYLNKLSAIWKTL